MERAMRDMDGDQNRVVREHDPQEWPMLYYKWCSTLAVGEVLRTLGLFAFKKCRN